MALGAGGAGVGYGGQGTNISGFPQTGGQVRETKEERIKREEAEARLNDPYGLRQNPSTPQNEGTTRVVRKKVRVRRNTGQSDGTNGTNGSGGTEGTNKGANRYAQNGSANSLLNRTWNGQSSLVRASVLFQNNQAQNLPQQNNSNLAVRNQMLQGLNKYIQNDYQMMKLNPDDKAFTYRTAEARQLGATIGQMVASTSRQTGGNTKTSGTSTTSGTTTTSISPEAYGRQKTLLRRLSAMSDPNPKMPDNLPADYRPFESVA